MVRIFVGLKAIMWLIKLYPVICPNRNKYETIVTHAILWSISDKISKNLCIYYSVKHCKIANRYDVNPKKGHKAWDACGDHFYEKTEFFIYLNVMNALQDCEH